MRGGLDIVHHSATINASPLAKKVFLWCTSAMDIFSLRQIDIARALNRPKSTVCKWFRKRRIPIHELERIENIFGFKREDLRPDVPWRKE